MQSKAQTRRALPGPLWREVLSHAGSPEEVAHAMEALPPLRRAVSDRALYPELCELVTHGGNWCPQILDTPVRPWAAPDYCGDYCNTSDEAWQDAHSAWPKADLEQELTRALRLGDLNQALRYVHALERYQLFNVLVSPSEPSLRTLEREPDALRRWTLPRLVLLLRTAMPGNLDRLWSNFVLPWLTVLPASSPLNRPLLWAKQLPLSDRDVAYLLSSRLQMGAVDDAEQLMRAFPDRPWWPAGEESWLVRLLAQAGEEGTDQARRTLLRVAERSLSCAQLSAAVAAWPRALRERYGLQTLEAKQQSVTRRSSRRRRSSPPLTMVLRSKAPASDR